MKNLSGLIILSIFLINCKNTLVFFYRLRNKLPQKCIRILYFAFVYPHLLNGIEIYANTGSTHLEKLQKLNNKILRVVQNKPYNSPVFNLYKAYNTLRIPQLQVKSSQVAFNSM